MSLINISAKTVKSEVVLSGAGLHSGQIVQVRLLPAQPGLGIRFIRADLPQRPAVYAHQLDPKAPPFRMTIRNHQAEVQTIEHLLATFSGLGVTDCDVELGGVEVPGMDGSAKLFAEAILQAGLTDSLGKAKALVVEQPVSVCEGAASISVMPKPGVLEISYTLHYPGQPLAQGHLELTLSPERFLKEIAPARTFAPKQDAEAMLAAGLGKGANYQNTVVMDGGRVLETTLRFKDEPVRHKILDLIGDIYTLGVPLQGQLVARCSGHRQNRQLVARLVEAHPEVRELQRAES